MKKFILITVPFFLCSFLLLGSSAFATSITNFGDDDVSVIDFSVVDIAGGVRFSVDVSGGPIVADITGVFFDLGPAITLTSVTPYDSSPTDLSYLSSPLLFDQDEADVKKAPNNSNMGNSIPKFDVGVAIGATGLSDGGNPDDFQAIVFDVLGSGLDALDITRIGVRLQSVGELGESRTGSAKYVTTVPEPATMLLFGAGLIGLAGIGRRKFFKK